MRPHITHAYIALRPCGCCVDTVLDDPRKPDDVAKALASFKERGLTTERVTCAEVGQRLRFCGHKRTITLDYSVLPPVIPSDVSDLDIPF